MSTEEQIRKLLGGQSAPQSAYGGVRLLLRCMRCGRVWEQDGPHVTLDHSPERIAEIAAELGADLAGLPSADCRLCSLQALGEINLDGYSDGTGAMRGLGISWEATTEAGVPAHLLLTVHLRAWMEENARRGCTPRSGVVTDFACCRAVLAWLEHLPYPSAGYHPITCAQSEQMATMNRPGFGMRGSEDFVWQGALWEARCAALGGRVVVNAALALPESEVVQISTLLAVIRSLATTIQAGHIAGEQP